jgi:hypothetical protein
MRQYVLAVLLLVGAKSLLLTAQAQVPASRAANLPDPLQTRVPLLELPDATVSDAIHELRQQTKENIFVDWEAMEAANVDRNAQITLHLKDLTLREALAELLAAAGAAPGALKVVNDDGVVSIVAADKPERDPKAAADPNQGANVKERLARPLPRADLSQVPAHQVFIFLGDISGIRFEIRWPTIEAAGISANTPLNIKFGDGNVEECLQQVLKQLGGEKLALGYAVKGDRIMVSTDEDLKK